MYLQTTLRAKAKTILDGPLASLGAFIQQHN